MLIKSIEVAIAGGILCLDRVFLQAMISRPLIAGPIIGALLNDPYTGLIAGAFVELIWIDRLPIGNHIPPNGSVVAILITAGSILAGNQLGQLSQSLFVFAFLLFLPVGPIGKRVESLIKNSNNLLSEKAMEAARDGNIKGIFRLHISGLLKTFLSNIVLIFIPLIVGFAILLWLYPLLPVVLLKALDYTYFVIPLVGVAVALNTIKLRGTVPLFSGLFLILTVIVNIF